MRKRKTKLNVIFKRFVHFVFLHGGRTHARLSTPQEHCALGEETLAREKKSQNWARTCPQIKNKYKRKFMKYTSFQTQKINKNQISKSKTLKKVFQKKRFKIGQIQNCKRKNKERFDLQALLIKNQLKRWEIQ